MRQLTGRVRQARRMQFRFLLEDAVNRREDAAQTQTQTDGRDTALSLSLFLRLVYFFLCKFYSSVFNNIDRVSVRA